MAKIKKINNAKCWQRFKATKLVTYYLSGLNRYSDFGEKKHLPASTKAEHKHALWLSKPFLGIYPEEIWTYLCQKIRTRVFLGAPYITIKTWGKLKCVSTRERVKPIVR